MKAKNENGKITTYTVLPSQYRSATLNVLGGFEKMGADIHKSEGFFDVVEPAHNPDTQKLGAIYFDAAKQQFTYPVTDKTDTELKAEIEARLDALDAQIDFAAVKRLLQHVAAPLLSAPGTLTEQQIADAASIYPQWRPGVVYKVQDRISRNGKLMEVIQAHTSQADWLPENLPALYKVFTPAGAIADWVQPLGAHDAYQIGDRVKHAGKTWESTAASNTWEPGVYGWIEI